MIDGGSKRASQPTGKNAADFVDWTFARDYGLSQIHLDVMMPLTTTPTTTAGYLTS
jgi:hypothetical protein